MSRLRTAVTTLAFAVGLIVPAVLTQSASAQVTTHAASRSVYQTTNGHVVVVNATPTPFTNSKVKGCPSGDVCMYTSSGWSNNSPEHKWYNYGCYNLSNEYGTRYVLNNQTGGALAALWYNYGCTNLYFRIASSSNTAYYWEGSITPINSINLEP